MRYFLILTSIFLASCGSSSSSSNNNSDVNGKGLSIASAPNLDNCNKEKIYNGHELCASELKSTVKINIGSSFCSAVFINKTQVLTAAHCAIGSVPSNINFNGLIATAIDIFPGYEEHKGVWSGTSPNIAVVPKDLAMVTFNGEFDTTVPVIGYEPNVGESILVAGYGRTNNTIRDYGPLRFGYNQISDVSRTHIIFVNDLETDSGIAPGDSGGPSFVVKDNKLYLVGIHSGGDYANPDNWEFGTRMSDTLVSTYLGWILEKTNNNILLSQ